MNIKIPGESIKTKDDAEKCFKDHNMDVVSDGWKERKARIESKDKECDKAIYYAAKQRVYGKYFGFGYAPGQFEKIFKKGGQDGETN